MLVPIFTEVEVSIDSDGDIHIISSLTLPYSECFKLNQSFILTSTNIFNMYVVSEDAVNNDVLQKILEKYYIVTDIVSGVYRLKIREETKEPTVAYILDLHGLEDATKYLYSISFAQYQQSVMVR